MSDTTPSQPGRLGENLEASGIRVFLNAFESSPEYASLLEKFDSNASLLAQLGIREIIHRPQASEWKSSQLILGTDDVSVDAVTKILQSLKVLAGLSADFTSVDIDYCVFPQALWAARYVQSQRSVLRRKFKTLHFTNHFARVDDALFVDTCNPRSFADFGMRLQALVNEATERSAPDLAGAAQRFGSEYAEGTPRAPRTVQRRARSQLLDVFRQIPLPAKALAVAEQVSATVSGTAKLQLHQEKKVRGDIAAQAAALLIQGAEVQAQARDTNGTVFSVSSGGQFSGWVIRMESRPPFSFAVERYAEIQGAWKKTQTPFRGTLPQLRARLASPAS